jgi:GT2 family glycosyltransferase
VTARLSFSVVVPTHRRPAELAECLSSLRRIDFAEFEVVVVDDGGPDDLRPIVRRCEAVLPVRLVRTTRGGPGAARNVGARHARGHVLAFTDDDCRPSTDWLRRLESAFARTPGALAGGRTINRLAANPYSATSQMIVDVAYAHHNPTADDVRFVASNNMAIPADRFAEIGGFDQSFVEASEDRDLCDRWRARGFPLRYVDDAIVLHGHRLSFGSFVCQHVRYGRGARRFHRARAARGTGDLLTEAHAHLRFLRRFSRPLAELPVRRRLETSALLMVWQIANAVGFVLGSGGLGRATGGEPCAAKPGSP